MNEKKQWVSSLHVISTISIIFVHVSANTLKNFGTIGNSGGWVAHMFECMSRFAVPVFLMLTGALILPKYDSLKLFFQKRFGRILPPFLFWSLIYITEKLFIEYYISGSLSWYDIGYKIIQNLAFGSAYHLWYIYMLIGLYLCMPIFARWLKNTPEKEIKYFLVIWIFALFASLLNDFPGEYIKYFSGYIGYLVLGYYLSRKQMKSPQNMRLLGIGLYVLGFLITFLGTYLLSAANGGEMNTYFYNRTSPNILLCAIGLFLFFRNLPYNTKKNRIVNLIESNGYGIYLIHVLMLSVIYHLGINGMLIHPIIGIPVTSLLCLVFSTLVIQLLKKIPYGKYIAG